MKLQEFLPILREAIDIESQIALEPATKLESVPGWDSMAMVSLLATLDLRHNIITSAQKIRNCETVGDLFKLVETA